MHPEPTIAYSASSSRYGMATSYLRPGKLVELLHDRFQLRQDAAVKAPLRDLPLHVAVLVLHHAGHERDLRIHQVADVQRGMAYEALHHLRLEQAHVFDGVGGEEPVLHIEERRLGLLGDASGYQREVARLLRVARVQHAPAAVRHAVDIVMAGVDVERMRRERARADVEHDRQPLSGDGIEHLLHKDETLAGGKVGDAASGDRESFARGGCAVLGLGFDESQFFAPEVTFTVRHLALISPAHGGG